MTSARSAAFSGLFVFPSSAQHNSFTTMAIAANNNNNVVVDYKHFWKAFVQAKGATHILIVSTLYSFGIGSVIGLVSSCKYSVRIGRRTQGKGGNATPASPEC